MDQTCSAPAAPAGLTVQVCFPGVRAAVLDNLNRQREEGRLCDLSIQVQGQVFRAHRCVLAASSPYFHDQVLLKNVTTVSLPSVMDPVAFESVLSSAYTGQLSIVHDDIVNYVTVASFLQMWHIVDKCTEILKRPRPSVETGPGEAPAAAPSSASRQQSPSSTDCLFTEREERRKEKNPDALPPLATWRRPQQFPRWGRQKPSSAQHLADSQLDGFAGCAESEYSNCEEMWLLSHAKASHFGHDGPGHYSRHHGGFPGGEPLKQRARFTQRGPTPGADRLPDKNRESEELQEKKRNEKRDIEPDEGVGEQGERKESCAEMRHSDFHQSTNESQEVVKAAEKGDAGEKVGLNPSADLATAHGCETAGPGSAQLPWQATSWSQQEPRLLEGSGGPCGKNEGEVVEVECFGRDTYDEIEDGTGQVSQRPLVPVSPDFTTTGSEGTWPSTGMGQGSSLTPTSSRHLSPTTASFPPSSSPPTPSSSSSVTLAGAPYTGKVHFCHCGKAYTLKSMRDRHVKMQHLNLRPFGCPVCAKTFKMKHHLTKHLKTHGGLRPYECNLCGKKVIWRDSFLRHHARCERLASGSSANGNSTSAAAGAADMDVGCSYSFEDGEAFLPTGGHVKVEQVDFNGEMEGRMDGLLGNVSGIVDNLRSESQHLDAGSHIFKQEERESFG